MPRLLLKLLCYQRLKRLLLLGLLLPLDLLLPVPVQLLRRRGGCNRCGSSGVGLRLVLVRRRLLHGRARRVGGRLVTLALEAHHDDHSSTTKGCYTGQEIVARIHTYGHVNRKLCLLRLPMGEAINEPVVLHELEDDLAVGRVMHAVPLAQHDMRLGLGYLPPDFQAIGTRLTLAGQGDVEVIGFDALPESPPA